ncbi:type VII secretion protein EccB [Streptomyces sp. NPDC048290]|uniref:type VII secretion protein EccB n=1 Tax=Streptomyces sp. NPDC048290 TaxID=3155811 RepID=UPI00342F2D23
MQTRKDQIQAHTFVMRRLASAMVRANPDTPDTPVSRTSKGYLWGLVIGLFIGLVVFVIGVLFPAAKSDWRTPGTLVLVKGGGGRYLFLGDRLHPVLNETSARLVAGDRMKVAEVKAKSLESTPRGAPLGLIGAPDVLPPADRMKGGSWLACATRTTTDTGATAPVLTLAVGLGTGHPALDDRRGVVVSDPQGARHLLWDGRRLRLDDASEAVQALGYGNVPPIPVSDGFLNALPEGPTLAAPDIPGRGAPADPLAGAPATVGQLFTGPSGDPYVLTGDGLAPLTATGFDLLKGDPRTQREAYDGAPVTPRPLGPDDLSARSAGESPRPLAALDGLPLTTPEARVTGADHAVCAGVTPDEDTTRRTLTVVPAAELDGGPPAVQPGVTPSCTPADRIAVRPGTGALVQGLSGGDADATPYLVTDGGVKYPVPGAEAAAQLGYGGVEPQRVPTTLLRMLPTGPSLDPALMAKGGVVTPQGAPEQCLG